MIMRGVVAVLFSVGLMLGGCADGDGGDGRELEDFTEGGELDELESVEQASAPSEGDGPSCGSGTPCFKYNSSTHTTSYSSCTYTYVSGLGGSCSCPAGTTASYPNACPAPKIE